MGRVCAATHVNRARYMGLNDLLVEIKQDPNSFLGDETTETKVLRQVLALVEDKISEVKNQAVKWYVRCCCFLAGGNDVDWEEAWVSSSRSSENLRWSSSLTS